MGVSDVPPVHLVRDYPPGTASAKAARGEWVRVRRGAYTDAAPDLGDHATADRHAFARTVAAYRVLAGVVLSHTSAAQVWGLPLLRAPDRVHVFAPWAGSRGAARDVVRHMGRLDAGDVTEVAGFRATSAERTVVDCVLSLDPAGGLVVADGALARGVDLGGLLDRLARLGPVRGVRRARAVLAVADAGAESPGESVARLALLRLGLPAPVTQVHVETDDGDRWADMGWPQWRVIVEYDGRAKYATGGAALDVVLAEKRRQEAITEAGWTVLRLVGDDLRHPDRLRRRLARHLPPAAFATCPPDLHA
ncbi:hypothetical protein N869_05735 [Cellulomonas bogoriensis 69B4 = DSM 16987]|uniref:DUF559 domain-containing protein n=1 Tax=Cellulomonas bogoriensis 69B4 = DSM 16987 TaxID=1386082 RepID=A0A0A0BQ25_9CELL|nr:hypothetical protein N869_05735 [Cellulomonas bogoriensis 69B4 = DSM 16987]